MGALTGRQAQLERMGARSESGHYRSLPPVTVSVRPFFLEAHEIGSLPDGKQYSTGGEVIVTSCFDSLVCGKAKTGDGALPRRRSRVTTVRHGNVDAPRPLYFVPWLPKAAGNGFPLSSPNFLRSKSCLSCSERHSTEVVLVSLQVWSAPFPYWLAQVESGTRRDSAAHMEINLAVWSVRL